MTNSEHIGEQADTKAFLAIGGAVLVLLHAGWVWKTHFKGMEGLIVLSTYPIIVFLGTFSFIIASKNIAKRISIFWSWVVLAILSTAIFVTFVPKNPSFAYRSISQIQFEFSENSEVLTVHCIKKDGDIINTNLNLKSPAPLPISSGRPPITQREETGPNEFKLLIDLRDANKAKRWVVFRKDNVIYDDGNILFGFPENISGLLGVDLVNSRQLCGLIDSFPEPRPTLSRDKSMFAVMDGRHRIAAYAISNGQLLAGPVPLGVGAFERAVLFSQKICRALFEKW